MSGALSGRRANDMALRAKNDVCPVCPWAFIFLCWASLCRVPRVDISQLADEFSVADINPSHSVEMKSAEIVLSAESVAFALPHEMDARISRHS